MNNNVESFMERIDEYGFTDEQFAAMKSLMSGENVFLTGDAGTGKSYVLNAFIDYLEASKKEHLVMAPTGIAALNLRNGSTIHRTLGIPTSPLDPGEAVGLPRNVLKEAEVIIIDEISMCRIDLFERAAQMILAAQKSSSKKQFVVVGDFFQLPPVMTQADTDVLLSWYPGNYMGFCFSSHYWTGFRFSPHVLHEVIRQTDPDFIKHLNLARGGDTSCLEYFNSHTLKNEQAAPADFLWLCATNRLADKINAERISQLPKTKLHTFRAVVTGEVRNSDKATQDELILGVGTRVMSLVNEKDGEFQNGSLGTVTRVTSKTVTVDFDNGTTAELRAFTWEINKYTVVSKREKDGTQKAHLQSEVIGTFSQIPLRLAYAITIHKSQGQTYDQVVVDTNCFADGQLYVGLSRCTTFENMMIFPAITEKRLHASDDVIQFYRRIEATVDTSNDVMISCPVVYAQDVRNYIAELVNSMASQLTYEDD